MEVPRHVLKLLFQTKLPLVQHHIDSYNATLSKSIPGLIQSLNPFMLQLSDRTIEVYIGGLEGTELRYEAPKIDDQPIFPHTCRLENKTYALSIYATVLFRYTLADNSKKDVTLQDILIGQIPLMLRSDLCYLSSYAAEDIGECKYELGGYFIIDGAEKVLITQELLGNNMPYAGTRTRKATDQTSKPSLIQQETAPGVNLKYGGQFEGNDELERVKYTEIKEEYAGLKTLSENGAKGPYSHFLVVPPETIGFLKVKEGSPIAKTKIVEPDIMVGNIGRDSRLCMIQLPGFQQPVPILSIFRALGASSDRDVYDYLLAGIPDKERNDYDDIFRQIVFSHERYIRVTYGEGNDLDSLTPFVKSKSDSEVLISIQDNLFSHIEIENDDRGALLRRKLYMLGYMFRLAIDIAIGKAGPSDRDNMQYKRLKTSGVLCFEEFQRIYRNLGREMLTKLDSKITYETKTYEGNKIVDLVKREKFTAFWKSYSMLTEFIKSFKGRWGGKVGVSQEVARPSYLATLHQLRMSQLDIDESMNEAPPRRLYASQFGIMCPIDSPDGSNIGYKKSLSILSRISTGSPSNTIKKVLSEIKGVFKVSDVHPSVWQPTWTKVFVNSDLYAVCVNNTELLHKTLMAKRRAGEFSYETSLAWNRVKNVYTIYCDAGRPIRPVYREGVTSEMVASCKTWNDILNLVDYIDASETECSMLSLEPYHPTLRSEIHMSFNLSAATNLVPYPDHNPATRSIFSIAQQKQAASWYHTNYMKRFDTISMFMSLPQKPLSQTWVYNEVMGRGGCLGYGINAIVAVTMYGGNNQEDSVLINQGSLKRGLFQTMYYHSYDVEEEIIEEGLGLKTQITNVLNHTEIKRKGGKRYEDLDADGIIRVGTMVTEDTVLVGMISPNLDEKGKIVGYKDISILPKLGQHGRVDGIYQYQKPGNRTCLKIRIVEERIPTLGDKMASRHAQKGTVGQIMKEEDLPFTASGIRPDIIFNPHGIPTRQTMGHFLEAACNKIGLKLGAFIDATPFTTSGRVYAVREMLSALGMEPNGAEVMYNGETGEMMEAEIFTGPIYYQRLKHMVDDKINYRDTGAKKLLTRQPTQGRADEGGLRIGEMERDVLIAHGMSKFLREYDGTI